MIEGDIRVSGHPKVQKTFARVMGYCEQVHTSYASRLLLVSQLWSAERVGVRSGRQPTQILFYMLIATCTTHATVLTDPAFSMCHGNCGMTRWCAATESSVGARRRTSTPPTSPCLSLCSSLLPSASARMLRRTSWLPSWKRWATNSLPPVRSFTMFSARLVLSFWGITGGWLWRLGLTYP